MPSENSDNFKMYAGQLPYLNCSLDIQNYFHLLQDHTPSCLLSTTEFAFYFTEETESFKGDLLQLTASLFLLLLLL